MFMFLNFYWSDIQTKESESNYTQIATEVAELIMDYNQLLCMTLSGSV